MLRLLTWIICDGSVLNEKKYSENSNKCRIQFKLSKQRKIERLENILQDNKIKYSKKESKKCGINKLQPYIIRFYGEKAREIYKIIGEEKIFPKNFQYLNKDDLDVIIKELKFTDGCQQNNRLLWSSTSKENLDIIQTAAILHGYECKIKEINKHGMNKKNIYLLTLYLKKQFGGIKTEVTIKNLKPQRVCCFNMPKGTLITRTNGIVTITGNCWLKYYSLDEIENIKSHEFKQHTMPQIYDMNLSDLRNFYRKLGQLAYFTFDNQRYIVSHGGIPYIPSEDGGLISIATEQLIKGVGDYKDNIDEIYANNENECKQIHAHRNVFELDNVNELSYNLEGRVEFGGELKILQLTKNSKPQMIKIKNNTYKIHEEDKQEEIKEIQNQVPIIEALRLDTKNIQEKDLGNNIHSFNFTRDAFYNKNWNQYTCKARGLFLDVETQNVVARGYEKFFNINEVKETELEHLLIKFKNKPITLYKKENGFLGIMSWVNGGLFIASKSTNEGNFARWFRKLYEKSSINKDVLEKYLQSNNVTLLFEVIDVEHDPHIIKYPESKLVLLDIVKNQLEFERLPYEKLVELAKVFNCECKSIYKIFDNVRDFHRWYLANTNEDDMSKEDIEGVVVECGDIMTKLKFPYYNFWKQMRGVKEKVRKKRNVELASLWNATSNYFYHWLKAQPKEELDKDIIYLREKYFSEKQTKEDNGYEY